MTFHLRRALARQRWAIPALLLALMAVPCVAMAQSLTLTEALTRAAAADPGRAVVEARGAAAQAAVRQAGVRPNPSIGVDLENFAGIKPYDLLDRVEATVAYEQTFERGGKREARIDRARADIERLRLRGEVARLDYLRDVQTAYAEALAAEAELVVAEARFVSARQYHADIAKRVQSARDPLFAGARAETLTAQAEIARDQAQAAARTARLALASYWDGGDDFTLDLSPFFDVATAAATQSDDSAPDLALLAADRDAALSEVRLEQSRAVSDPTLRAGVRYLGEGSGVAFVLGGSIPLQRYDRNQANVERAQAERNAAELDIVGARKVRDRDAARLAARMAASAREAERIRAEVIPAALQTVDLVRDGFNRGGFQYSDITEAERALADARARRVTVLRDYHLDKATLDRLTGRHAALPHISAETR